MKIFNYYSVIYYVVPELDGQIVRLSVMSLSATHTGERRIYNMITLNSLLSHFPLFKEKFENRNMM